MKREPSEMMMHQNPIHPNLVKPRGKIEDDIASMIFSLSIHIILISLVFLNSQTPPPQEELMAVEMVALTALGEQLKPDQLDRIVAPPPPPEPEVEQASISRVVEKRDEPKKKPKEAKKPEKKPKPKPKPKVKPKKRKKKRKKKRERVTKSDLFGDDDDPRADRGRRIGDPKGHAEGTSTRKSRGVVSVYASRVVKQISRQFKAPSSISKQQLRRLKAVIAIKLTQQGQYVAHIDGDPRWVSRSGNRIFDKAAMRALLRFKEGGIKLPLPKSPTERKAVLKHGFKVTLNGADY